MISFSFFVCPHLLSAFIFFYEQASSRNRDFSFTNMREILSVANPPTARGYYRVLLLNSNKPWTHFPVERKSKQATVFSDMTSKHSRRVVAERTGTLKQNRGDKVRKPIADRQTDSASFNLQLMSVRQE